ncbi:hypothetical protein ACFLWA_02020 [Chloroflexota bacterium]
MEEKPNSVLDGLNGFLEGRSGGWLFNVAIVVLLITVILLPPVSAQRRILDAGYVKIDNEDGGAISDPDGMQIYLLPDGLEKDVKLKEESIPMASFMDGSAGRDLEEAARALPSHLRVKSPIYTVRVKGRMPENVLLSVPVPNNAEPYETLSLYSWNGTEWTFLPSVIVAEDDILESTLNHVPEAVAVVQSAAQAPRVSAELPEFVSLPELGDQALAELNPLGYSLGADQIVEGNLASLPAMDGQESYIVLPNLRNWTDDGVVRSDLVDNMLIVPESQDALVQSIVALVVGEMYAGIDLDYQGINPELRNDYTTFVQKLAGELHNSGKRLTVHTGVPVQLSADSWDTGAYDWWALGQAADGLKFPTVQDPAAHAPGGQMEQLLRWAVGQVERYKLQPEFSARTVESAGGVLLERTYRDALSELSQVAFKDGGEGPVAPGQQVTLGLESAGLQHDPATGRHWFTYYDEASGEQRTIWLEDAGSLGAKLALLSRFNVGGVSLEALWDEGNDPRMWEVVRQYQAAPQMPASPIDSNFSLVWRVEDTSGGQVWETSSGIEQADYVWTAPDSPGEYTIGAHIVANNGQTVSGGEKVALVVSRPTETPTPLPSPTPLPTETPTPVPTTPTPEVAVEPTATPEPTAKPKSSGGGAAAPKPTAKPKASKPKVNTNFGYGIQAHMVDNGQEGMVMSQINDLGFGWVKQQVEWKHHEPAKGSYNWGSLDAIAAAADAAGVKVLWSAVNAPGWSRPGGDLGVGGPPNNPNDFADFLGALAGRYCGGSVKAIEVWNEQNLHYEWGNMDINAAAYMNLLRPAYNRIKQVCPSMIVVSGAPTPTGAPAPLAMDDFVYMEAMYQNGLKNFSDAIGAHPSGFNVAPSVKGGAAACDFITKDGASYRGPCNTQHHSWSFNATLNGYYNIMKKYGDGGKKIWPTEFGWATGWTGAPGYDYADDNTLDEQAAWTAESYQLMKQWGFVGVAFLWNLNFRVVAGGTEKAQWGIVWGDWKPTPAYNALKSMPK